MEPISIFSRNVDPAGVAGLLRRIADHVDIDGSDNDWQNAIVSFNESGENRTLTFTHDPDYYAEPNWSKQMEGMRGYFSAFPQTDRSERVIMLTSTFRFSLGTLFEPDFDPSGDPRLDVLFEVARHLDAVLFTPSSVRDHQGRILFDADGEDGEDPDAEWPQVLAQVAINDSEGTATTETAPESAPPTPQGVARRALVLAAVTFRAMLEIDAMNGESNVDELYRDLLEWFGELQIDDELEPAEAEILKQPFGELDEQSCVNAAWRLEGLVVLAWALGRFKIPPHDKLVDTNRLWKSLNLFDVPAARAMVDDATLKPPEEIDTLRNRLFAIHWRLRNYSLRPEVMDFAEWARTCWFGPLDLTGLPLKKGDLALKRKRLDRASADLFSTAHSAAQERHQAANWLNAGPEVYSEASIAT